MRSLLKKAFFPEALAYVVWKLWVVDQNNECYA